MNVFWARLGVLSFGWETVVVSDLLCVSFPVQNEALAEEIEPGANTDHTSSNKATVSPQACILKPRPPGRSQMADAVETHAFSYINRLVR